MTDTPYYPLSFHQERLWFIDRFETNNVYASHPVYHNIPAILHLRGAVQSDALSASLEAVVARHAALRCRVEDRDGDHRIQVMDGVDVPLHVVDDSSKGNGTDWLAWAEQEALRPFDLSKDTLIRASLRILSAQESVLVLTVHHLVVDRASLARIVEEIRVAYDANVYGGDTPDTEAALDYMEYAAWQQRLPRHAFEPLLFHWRWQLRGRLQALELPEDISRPAIHTYTAGRIEFDLPAELYSRVVDACDANGSSPRVWFLTAYVVLMHRLSLLEEIVIGVPFDNRLNVGEQNAVGPFSNLNVLRFPVDKAQSVAEIIADVEQRFAQASSHQQMPFDLLVQELKPQKDMSRTALFDVLYQYETHAPTLSFNGTEAEWIETNLGDGKYDFNLMMHDRGDAFRGILTYNRDIFLDESAQRVSGQYLRIVDAMLRDPSQAVSRIDLLSDDDKQCELVEWNQTDAVYPETQTVHGLFEAQVESNPDATALIAPEGTMTYGELDRAANRVANVLRTMGVVEDTLVAVCLGRCANAVVAMLGVIKAGGAYLPLNPDFPEDRLRFTLEDSGAVFLVSDATSVEHVPVAIHHTLLLDQDYDTIDAASDQAPQTECTPDSLLYCLYTSGSTGQPKGVLIEHRNVVRLLHNSALPFRFDSTDVWSVFHSYTFDFSVWELYGALLYGGTAVLVADDVAKDPEAFLDLLQTHGVTVLNQTPSAFYALMEATRQKSYPALAVREVVFGGEALNPRRLIDWHEAYPDCRLVNMYGITETTVHVTWKMLDQADMLDASSVIGEPIPTTSVILVDEHLQLVPPGVPGEMLVGGLGLARGYLNRDSLTEERFIEHPFLPGERLYHSGDLAKRRANGELVYLGRMDDQVQIRGFRVEVGEIQSRLLEHHAIREAEVVAFSDDDSVALAAYVVSDTELSLAELRAHVIETLPEYMVPGYIIPIANIPLTPNGKVDRDALPDPLAHRLKAESTYVAPRSDAEQRLAAIWAETLSVERVGIHDSFFELGGHSILATQLMLRIRQAFSVDLPLRRIFEAPTVAQLAEYIASEVESTQVTIPKASRDEAIPLSYSQRRLWILHQLEGASSTYNVSTALTIRGALDADALEQAFRSVMQRHEILRMVVDVQDEQPVQRFVDADGFTIRKEKIEKTNSVSGDLDARIDVEVQAQFALQGEMLIRALLIETGHDEHVLVLTLHHMITDGWSQSVLVQEIAEAYQAHSRGTQPSWDDLPIQYADYSVWQQAWMNSTDAEAQIGFWKSAMQDASPVLNLSTDRPRPEVQQFEGALKTVRFSSDRLAALTKFSQKHGVTLFMTLHAAFATLLARLSGQADIVTGTGVANRTRPEVEPLIGFFVNTILLRLDLADDPTFVELVQQAERNDLKAFENQDVPFERLVDVLQPERNLSYTPLFQVMFTLQNTPEAIPRLPGLSIEPRWIDSGVSKFDLTVLLHEDDEGLAGVVEYSTALFDASTIERIFQQYDCLLESLISQPERSVYQAAMLPELEEAALHYWSGRRVAYPRNETIVDTFAHIAQEFASKEAICFGAESLTYAELDRKSSCIAQTLVQRGVRAGDVVGVLASRGLRTPVAMLAILKAGAAYAPLDPSFPEERLAFMVEDSAITVVLTSDTDHPICCTDGVKFLAINDCLVDQANREFDPIAVSATDPAYVVYTSGSTGAPKGVVVPHRGVPRLVLECDYCPIDPSDRIAHASTVTFDAATFEIWGALLNGATVVGLERDIALAPHRFGETLRDSAITTLFITTALFNEIARQAPDAFACLRHVLFGGEAVDPRWVQRILRQGAPDRLVHLYGPTENTTFSTWHRVWDVDDHAATVPIGQAIANSTAYVVDERLQLLPIGVVGELVVGGDGLALEYLGRPDATQEAFVTNPFDDDPDSRLYRTGDLVRRRTDGAIEFVGRRDHQVKVRGFRVELDEIAAYLNAETLVQESLVVLHNGTLAAYVVAAVNDVAGDDLRAALAGKIPEYMIPTFFVFLDAFPLNANGKIDRNALPEPQAHIAEEQVVEPQTETQRSLASIWMDVLSLERIGIHDNFFYSGGHSLSATQVISRIREEFSVELPLRCLFQTPTIAGLAVTLEQEREAGVTQTEGIPRIERSGRYALSYAQERLWFLDKIEPDNPFYNVAIALSLHGELNVDAFRKAFHDVMARHEILRAGFAEQDGVPYVSIQADGAIAFPVESLRVTNGVSSDDELLRICVDEARRPFDLRSGQLIRARLIEVNETHRVLLLSMHHIISDGWSLGVLIHEWLPLYQQHCDQRGDVPDTPSVQYVDFAAWQRDWLTGDVLEEQCSYWKQKLDGAPPVLQLPTDRPRPAAQSFRGGGVQFSIDAETVAGIRRLNERSDSTMYMTLLATYAVLLFRYSGQQDMVIGSPIANRTRKEFESLIGFFVNTLAMRIDCSESPSFDRLLDQVRTTALEAFAHQDLPFEKLVDELNLERDLSVNPLFQVMFALQNAPMDEIHLPGLDVSMVDTPRVTALFDLVMDVWETGDTLTGVLEYNADLFDEATAQRMVSHYARILNRIARDASIPITDIALLSPEEEHQLLHDWAGPVREYRVDQPIHALFEQMATEAPERIAVVHNGQTMSYGDLNRAANRIAHQLRAAGVSRNDFVGVLVPRGIDCLTALLAVLKAGGAFTPIDPAYPDERIQYMIADSQVRVLIADSATIDVAKAAQPSTALEHIVCIDKDDFSTNPESNPEAISTPRDYAYMLYTSGSTGMPKGAIVRHDGAVNHMFSEFELLNFGRDSAFLQSAPSSSDISVWQFLAPGVIGARTVIVDYETVCDPEALFRLIQAERVSLIELVPVVMKEMLEYARGLSDEDRALPHLDMAMATGESVPVSLVNQWLEMYPGIPIVNAYGPTEAADDVCQLTISEPLPADARSVPIGYPLQNLRMYVLDENLRLVPIGAAGELCVAGIGVGAGYYNQPEKTHAAFVENPYAHHEQERVLYRTGDLGYWRADGILECMERLDFQVKIRGFRIELGEIEGVLSRYPSVREVAAKVHGEADDKYIAAHMTVNLEAPETQALLDELNVQQVELWQTLHEDSYVDTLTYGDETFNVIGWDSNYTNQPLPELDMREYVDHTVGRILALKPKCVYEIGCGTGLILFPLLPHLERYEGVDASSVAIDQLKELQLRDDLCQRVDGLRQATFACRLADDFIALDGDAFDTVLLPSVVQYFPGIDYLTTVIEGLCERLQPGGAIVLGDVRNLRLLKMFHASVQLHKAEGEMALDELAERIRRQLESEQEMAIYPEYFYALVERIPQLSHVELLPKRGTQWNEMTCFRYDVVLHIDAPIEQVEDDTWSAWSAETLSLDAIRAAITEPGFERLALRRIANQRVERDVHLLRLMDTLDGTRSADELRHTIDQTEAIGIDPEALISLADDLGVHIELHTSLGDDSGAFDAVIRREALQQKTKFVESIEANPWHEYANNPLQEKLQKRLSVELREHCSETLPAYMVPTSYEYLDAMPLTPAGKIDRVSLQEPTAASRSNRGDYVAPVADDEKQICQLWVDVLGCERVGMSDNFFDLGGHSLKATQVVSRLQRDMQVECSLRELFTHPTPVALLKIIRTRGQKAVASIPKSPDADHYPLSHGQRRLWVLSQMDGASAAYNMPAALLLDGEIDRDAFQDAFDALVLRHESLRTAFRLIEGEPRQVVLPEANTSLNWVDLSTEADAEARARDLAMTDAEQPFDFEQGGLVRATLVCIAEKRHVLLFNMHHIISDEISMNVLVQEFVQQVNDRKGSRKPLGIQYRDFSSWQAEYLETDAGAKEREYWHEQLQGDLPVLQLSYDLPRPSVKTFAGASVAFTLPPRTIDRLREYCSAKQCSTFVFFGALVHTLLYRYSGQQDIITGYPVSGRTHADLEDQIGFYVNTLPLRILADGETAFTEVLGAVQRRVHDALDHQNYPFDRLVDELAVTRDVSRSPIFDVVIVMQEGESAALELPGVSVQPFVDEYPMAKFDLAFNLQSTHAGMQGDIVFNTDLFQVETVQRMSDHLMHLLEAALDQPTCAIGKLNWLSEAERKRAIEQSRPRESDAPLPYSCLSEWFETQVKQTPDAIAVRAQRGDDSPQTVSLTYAELNANANAITQYLQQQGVGINTRVGIYMERNEWLVAAIVAIGKAGGTYVPFDPTHPADRIAFMIDDASIDVVLTETSLVSTLPDAVTNPICVDELFAQQDEDCENLANQSSPDDIAYVIYTSGTTGKPKGVQVTHRNVMRLFTQTQPDFSFGSDDVWTLFHSAAFDFSVWELWGALLYGGCLVVVPYWVSRSPEDFYALVRDEGVTVLNQTPSAFRHFMQSDAQLGHAGSLLLRYVIFGGEALDYTMLRSWYERHEDHAPRLVNMFGITETTVHVTRRDISASDALQPRSYIGEPIADLGLMILDEHGLPCPQGVAGELYVCGAGVARGYVDRDELTQDRFVPNPLTGDPNDVVYRTGDRARRHSIGEIEYLGRVDQQVQLRGFRIELGEIETVLRSLGDIRDAVVGIDGAGDDQRLVAWCIPTETMPEHDRVRDGLLRHLPEYMVPSFFVEINKVPLTANGKLDAKALPRPSSVRPELSEVFLAPRTELETTISELLKEMLGLETIGIRDNFFDLGANSLLLVQASIKLREHSDQKLSVVHLFQHPTVESLARFLAEDSSNESGMRDAAQDRAAKRAQALRRKRARRS